MARKKKTVKSSRKGGASPASFGIMPLGDRVVVRPLSAEELGTTTSFGIIIPDTAQEKPEQGEVVAVGPGKFDNGVRSPMEVSVGDRILFGKYGYETVKLEGKEYYVISQDKILAVIKN